MQFPFANVNDWTKVSFWYSPFTFVFFIMSTGRGPYPSFQYLYRVVSMS